jgi:hypothetical protein
MTQSQLFDNTVELTNEDHDILMFLLDESSYSIDDGNDDTIMNDMTRLRMIGFDVIQCCDIMKSTDNNPFGYVM